MIDFIPLEQYYTIFINVSLFFVLLTVIHTYTIEIDDSKNIVYTNIAGYIFLAFTLFYVGLRPVSGKFFGDMATYNRHYTHYMNGGEIMIERDFLFHYFMKLSSYIIPPTGFFLICFALYLIPMYKVSKVFFKEYWFYSFLMFAVSFSFWSYGTNGIRNGIAASFFLLALCYLDRKPLMVLFFVLATQIHQTLILPVLAFALTHFVKDAKIFLKGWLIAIPLSILFGGVWINLFASLGFADDRLSGYLLSGNDNASSFSSTGFRYDFLLYSSAAVFCGWYFIFKKEFKDQTYQKIYSTYLICNAFWILVIRANFSNRFAYLSWFLMSLVIVYPYLKKNFFENHHIVIGQIIGAYFLFTYLMYFVYYN